MNVEKLMNKTIKNFEELNIWQNARELVKMIYGFTRQEKFTKDYSLTGQITRASVSIMSNIFDIFSLKTQGDRSIKSIKRSTCNYATVQLYKCVTVQLFKLEAL